MTMGSLALVLAVLCAVSMVAHKGAMAVNICNVPMGYTGEATDEKCIDFCQQLTDSFNNRPEACSEEAFVSQGRNMNITMFIAPCVELALPPTTMAPPPPPPPMSPPPPPPPPPTPPARRELTFQDIGICPDALALLDSLYGTNNFMATCTSSDPSRCARGPTVNRNDLDADLLAATTGQDATFIREYTGSGGVSNAYTMSFGLLEPRTAATVKVVDDIPLIPVYLDLTFTLPSKIDNAQNLMDSTILLDGYFSLEFAESLYGVNVDPEDDCDCFYDGPLFDGECECYLDGWTVQAVFDNLRERKDLLETVEALVDCGSGWCTPLMPDGFYYKRSSYFQGTFKQTYDFSRFPFDTQVFWLNFTLLTPYGFVSIESTPSSYPINVQVSGFTINEMNCFSTNIDNTTWGGACRMEGERESGPSILNLIIPSLLFVMIAFSSLAISVSKSMPRVAMTMFALLVVTQQRAQILSSLPSSESFVWIDMYLFCCIIVIVTIMLSHAFSERMVERAKNIHQKTFDRMLLKVLPALLIVLVIIVTLAATGVATAVWISVGIVLTTVIIIVGLIWFSRRLYIEMSGRQSFEMKSDLKGTILKVGRHFSRSATKRRPPSDESLREVNSTQPAPVVDAIEEDSIDAVHDVNGVDTLDDIDNDNNNSNGHHDRNADSTSDQANLVTQRRSSTLNI